MDNSGFGTIVKSIDVALERQKLTLGFAGAFAFIAIGALFAFLAVAVSDEAAASFIFLFIGGLASWVTYSLFSGALTHMSWSDLNGSRKPSPREALSRSQQQLVSFLFSPLALLALGLMVVVTEVLFLLLGRIPYLGELLASVAYLPLVIVNMLLVIGITAGMWLVFPIVAARGAGIRETLEEVVDIVRRSPMRLVTYFILAFVVVFLTLGMLWSVVGIGRSVTLRAMNAGVGEETMRQIAGSGVMGFLANPGAGLGSLLFGSAMDFLPEPLGALLGDSGFGSQFFGTPVVDRFTMDIAGFIMGLSTVALVGGVIFVFPWVFTLTVSCAVYQNLATDTQRKYQGVTPARRVTPPPPAATPEKAAYGASYQPPAAAQRSVSEHRFASQASEPNQCIECKRAIKTNSRFCPYCGAAQS